ncbi:MAG: hypothetical protein HC884_12845 [Chloroflexaceae bacterium]|nr:hypothetical protein [Chloroflexaceae bacterium]
MSTPTPTPTSIATPMLVARLNHWASKLGWLLLLVAALVVADVLSLHLHGGSYQFAMGDGVDRLLVHHFHSVEQDSQGKAYRWSLDHSTIAVRGSALVPLAALTLNLGGMPEHVPVPHPVQARLDGNDWLTFSVGSKPRAYALLLPPPTLRDGSLDLEWFTGATHVPPDPRKLGIRLDRVSLRWLDGSLAFPTWTVLAMQGLVIATAMAMAWYLALPRWSIMVIAASLVVALGWLVGSNILIAGSWLARILVTNLALLGLLWSVAPCLRRVVLPAAGAAPQPELRWLWLVTVLAIALRMVVMLYPPFEPHDWYIHRKRIVDFLNGAFVLYDKPAEFSTRLTVVPPAPYLFFAPFTLLTSNPVVAMQGVYAFLDGVTALLVGVMTRFFGGSLRAAGVAALVFALFPLNFTALWWGFGPQVIGQCLTVLFVLFVLFLAQTPLLTRWAWGLAGLVFTLLLLSHVGAGILGGFLLAGYLALIWGFRRNEEPRWKGWGLTMVTSGAAVTLLLYSTVIAMQLDGLSSNQRLAWDAGDIFRVQWTLASLNVSFAPVGVILPILSIAFLVISTRPAHRWLLAGWLASAGLFFAVDLATGLQVRYAYFLVPLFAVGLGMVLDGYLTRHRVGWVVAGCLIGIVGVVGLHLWGAGIFGGIKPSLRGLTH